MRKPIICINFVLLIHRKRSPFSAGEGLGWHAHSNECVAVEFHVRTSS